MKKSFLSLCVAVALGSVTMASLKKRLLRKWMSK